MPEGMAGAAFFAERRGCEVAVVWQRRRRFRPAIALPQHVLAQFKIKIRLFEILSPLPAAAECRRSMTASPSESLRNGLLLVPPTRHDPSICSQPPRV